MNNYKTAKAVLIALASTASTWATAAQPLGCLIEPHRVIDVGSPVIVGRVEWSKSSAATAAAKGDVIAVLRADVERAAVNVAATRAKVAAEVQAAQANPPSSPGRSTPGRWNSGARTSFPSRRWIRPAPKPTWPSSAWRRQKTSGAFRRELEPAEAQLDAHHPQPGHRRRC